MAIGKRPITEKLRRSFAEGGCLQEKSPYPKTHHPKYTKLVKEQLENVLAMKDSILHELFDGNALNKLVETDGASFQRPWYGQLMTGPQLLAYLWQIHIWFEKYRINII